MLWSGWGDPDQALALAPEVEELLRSGLGITEPTPAVAVKDVRVPDSRLPEGVRERLVALVGREQVRSDKEARISHTRGKSTPDLLRIRGGDAAQAPDAVILPSSHEQVLAVLRLAAEERLAVAPFGGGTSVVGGLAPRRQGFAAAVALDLRLLDRLIEVDDVSRIAVFEPGVRAPEAEALLAQLGFTLGHFPQSFEYASLGGFAATRSSGQASAGYGRFDERVVALRVATPRGTLELGRAPRSAAGPDLRQLFLGSEGTLGVITALSVEVSPKPERALYEGWRFEDFHAGIEAMRRLAQDGPTPTVLRLSDEAETALNLARPSDLGGSANNRPGCLAITGYEGRETEVLERRTRASAMLRQLEAEPDATAGASWASERYRGPYLRDALLGAGALVETLETATFWSNLEPLYRGVKRALQERLTELGTPPVVLCHVSHVYRSGASLYFTVGAAQLEDPLSQWAAAKQAAGDAILRSSGTITHHHGVGSDHAGHYAAEVGPLALEVLRAVKSTLDPTGILNPGVLLG